MKNYRVPTLTIAGSDSSGGAGIHADLKTFSAIGTYGMSVITAITAQNTEGVFDVEELSSKIIKEQIKAVCEDIMPNSIKIGMVSSPEIILDIAESLKKYPCKYIVVDPVMISKSGYSLLRPEAKENLIKYLIPMAYIVTPNIPEAEEISNMKIDLEEDGLSVKTQPEIKLNEKIEKSLYTVMNDLCLHFEIKDGYLKVTYNDYFSDGSIFKYNIICCIDKASEEKFKYQIGYAKLCERWYYSEERKYNME